MLELNEWFHSYNPGRGNMDNWVQESGGIDLISHELLDGFKSNFEIRSVKKRGDFSLFLAAASLLLICSVAFLFYYFEKKPHGQIAKAHVESFYKIKPGSNRAILKLANGTQVILNSTTTGHIAIQNNMQINKVGAGSISYRSVTNHQPRTAPVYNTMTTPRGGRFSLTLADGTEVTLDAESSIVYPVAFIGKERRVEITGQAYFKVVHDVAQPFRVSVKGQTIQDVGTAFNVSAYDDDASVKVTLTEGLADVSSPLKKVRLLPGLQAEVLNGQSNIAIRKVNVEEVTAWKNGWFAFHNETIEEVMKQAARWYDIDVAYEGEKNSKKFGGTISQYKDISELLENLKITGGINYKIEGRRVTLTK